MIKERQLRAPLVRYKNNAGDLQGPAGQTYYKWTHYGQSGKSAVCWDSMRLMEFEAGLRAVEPGMIDPIIRSARQAGVPVFLLDTGNRVGRAALFDAIRAVLPLDPPLVSDRSWDALSDSLWEGLNNLDVERAIIVWPAAEVFRRGAEDEYDLAVQTFVDIAETLTDVELTVGSPKKISFFVGTGD